MIPEAAVEAAQPSTTRRVVAYTLLLIGAALPMLSAVAGWAHPDLSAVILLASFPLLTAGVVVAFTGATK